MRGLSCRHKGLTRTTLNVLKHPFSSSSSSSSSSLSSSSGAAAEATQTIDYPALTASTCAHRRTIGAKNAVVNAFVAVSPTAPKRHSKRTGELLRGLTIGVKDNIATSDLPTTCSSGILANYTSPFDATVVGLLRAAGADVIGKTNCDEFGMGSMNTHSIHGVVVNPHNHSFLAQEQGQGQAQEQGQGPQGPQGTSAGTTPERRSAGGSSGGSAAAVAAGMCDVALGTDTGGSIRLPASYCGVVGYKPSYGLLSRFGVVSYADSLDCVGVLGRDVDSVRKVGAVLNAYDPRDPTAAQPEIRDMARQATRQRMGDIRAGKRKLRIGVPVEYFPSEVSERLSDELRGLLRRLVSSSTSTPASTSNPTSTSAGTSTTAGTAGPENPTMEIEIVPVSLPSTPYALSAYYVLASAEASSNLARYDGVRYGVRVAPPALVLEDMVAMEGGGRTAGEVYAFSRTRGFGAEVKKRVLLGCYALSAGAFDNYFLQAQRVRQLVRDDFGRVFGMRDLYHGFDYPSAFDDTIVSPPPHHPDVDVLIHLSSIRTAPLLDVDADAKDADAKDAGVDADADADAKTDDGLESYVQDVLTVPASLAGLPALSVPMQGGGWPVGVCVVGQWGSDEMVLEVGRVVQGVVRGA